MKRLAYTLFFVMIISMAGLQSCSYEMITPEKVVVGDNITWTTDVLPIFTKNCNVAGCHVSGAVSPDLSATQAYISLVYFGYVNTNIPEESSVYTKLTTGSMKTYATEQEKAIILKWIQLGALEN